MAPRDRNFLQFVPPNLRPALSEAGRVGYNILDNIIGYDDNYDTLGELLARSLREDPLGTLGAMGGGLYEGVRTAVTEPVQTARNVADEFSEAFLRLREPLPEFASREDIAQRTSDLSILGAIIPGVRPAVRTVGAVGQIAARAVTGRRDYDPFDDQDLINELIDNMDTDLIDSVGVDPAPAADPTSPAPRLPRSANLARVDFEDDLGFGVMNLPEPQAGPDPGFQQTPFDPNDIDYGPDIDQIAAGADDPFAGGTNPWTNVQGAEDLAANYLPAPPPQIDIAPPAAIGTDPFRGLPGTRALNETAPAAALPEANPYMPTDRDFQIPQTWMDQGIAGAYSRSGRAADRLGQPQYTDIESLRRELEKHGAAPGELRYQLDQFEEAMLDGPLSREDIQRFFSDRDTGLSIDRNLEYAGVYMPPGGRNGTSTVYYHPAGQNYPPGAERHYGNAQGLDNASAPGRATTVNVVPLFHSRAAQYDLGFPGGGTTHHVVEIQSDFSQYRQGVPRTESERPAIKARMQELMNENNGVLQGNNEKLYRRLEAQFNGPLRDDFDEQFDAPYVRRENDWVDAAVRQNLLDAVNSGSDWITFGNGQQAHTHISMPLKAAKSFYDNRVPKRIEDVLRRFASEAGIDAPTLESVPFVDGSDVRGLRITPEFREALLRTGLPSYRFGGIVSLMRK
jgi:hypothetical protein